MARAAVLVVDDEDLVRWALGERLERELAGVSARIFELAGGSKTAKTAGVAASGFTAGLGLTLPLFDRGQADTARADARAREAKATLEAVDRQIRGEVEDAAARLADRLGIFRINLEFPRQGEHEFSDGGNVAFHRDVVVIKNIVHIERELVIAPVVRQPGVGQFLIHHGLA